MHISIQRGKLLPPTEFNKFVLFKSVSLNLLYSIESSFKTCIGSRSCNTPSLTSLRLTPKALQAFSYFVSPSASIFSSSPYLYIETLLSIHFQLYTYINFNIFVFVYNWKSHTFIWEETISSSSPLRVKSDRLPQPIACCVLAFGDSRWG